MSAYPERGKIILICLPQKTVSLFRRYFYWWC